MRTEADEVAAFHDRTAGCCGHTFQTVAQRRAHEVKVERGERVVCPCGDVCQDVPGISLDQVSTKEIIEAMFSWKHIPDVGDLPLDRLRTGTPSEGD